MKAANPSYPARSSISPRKYGLCAQDDLPISLEELGITLNPKELHPNPALYAGMLNMNQAQFDECLNTGKYAGKIKISSNQADRMGIKGVPGFILAISDPHNPQKAKGLSFIQGARPFSNIKAELDKALIALQ